MCVEGSTWSQAKKVRGREGGREGQRKGGREGGREGQREGGMERGTEEGREGGREGMSWPIWYVRRRALCQCPPPPAPD